MVETINCLTALAKSEITGEKIDISFNADARFDNIIKAARLHEMAHLAAAAMIKNNLLTDEKNIKTAERLVYEASYRDVKNNNTYELAVKALSEAKIPFVPLKGVLIKPFYPESWMRTSCDVDILVHKSDFEKSVKLFENMGFTIDGDLNFHDASMLFDDSNLELHFSICENMRNIDAVLKKVWENTVNAGDYKYLQTNEYFMFHHIAHMTYHFLAGGCGIRPFLDLWILRQKLSYDEEKVIEFCKIAKIYDFYKAVLMLTDVWFEGKEHTDLTKQMEKYLLAGGAYGYFPNNAAAYTVMHGGKVRYVLSIAFPKYVNMKALYPTLNHFPYLLPYFYVYRVFQKTVGRNSASAKSKFGIIKGQGDDFIKEVSTLVKALKLDK